VCILLTCTPTNMYKCLSNWCFVTACRSFQHPFSHCKLLKIWFRFCCFYHYCDDPCAFLAFTAGNTSVEPSSWTLWDGRCLFASPNHVLWLVAVFFLIFDAPPLWGSVISWSQSKSVCFFGHFQAPVELTTNVRQIGWWNIARKLDGLMLLFHKCCFINFLSVTNRCACFS